MCKWPRVVHEEIHKITRVGWKVHWLIKILSYNETKWDLFSDIVPFKVHFFHLCFRTWIPLVKKVINSPYNVIIWTPLKSKLLILLLLKFFLIFCSNIAPFSITTSLEGLEICWLYPMQRAMTPSHKRRMCPDYDTKIHLVVRLQFWMFRKCGIASSLWIIPGHLWSHVVVTLRVPSVGQHDLFENS